RKLIAEPSGSNYRWALSEWRIIGWDCCDSRRQLPGQSRRRRQWLPSISNNIGLCRRSGRITKRRIIGWDCENARRQLRSEDWWRSGRRAPLWWDVIEGIERPKRRIIHRFNTIATCAVY